MRIILSRKGFDASSGGVASPILPHGTLVSLPIPDRMSPVCYRDIRLGGRSGADLVAGLTRGRVSAGARAHLDPDLVRSSRPRLPGWRPALGQAGGAAGHLRRQGVEPGDVFLFFGWFRACVERNGRLRFAAGAPDLHVLFGWLQIGRIATGPALRSRRLGWASGHPHLHGARGASNTLYVARRRLGLPGGARPSLPGAGTFPRFHPSLQLTDPRQRLRGVWRLPAWFHPAGRGSHLSAHGEPSRWRRSGSEVLLRSVSRGQEFVLDAVDYPEAIPWLREILGLGS